MQSVYTVTQDNPTNITDITNVKYDSKMMGKDDLDLDGEKTGNYGKNGKADIDLIAKQYKSDATQKSNNPLTGVSDPSASGVGEGYESGGVFMAADDQINYKAQTDVEDVSKNSPINSPSFPDNKPTVSQTDQEQSTIKK